MVNTGVNGPGTFLPVLLDELSQLTPEVLREKANVEIVQSVSE
jgi:hydroxyethylthiazole kinase-like sugar kinase family protein